MKISSRKSRGYRGQTRMSTHEKLKVVAAILAGILVILIIIYAIISGYETYTSDGAKYSFSQSDTESSDDEDINIIMKQKK